MFYRNYCGTHGASVRAVTAVLSRGGKLSGRSGLCPLCWGALLVAIWEEIRTRHRYDLRSVQNRRARFEYYVPSSATWWRGMRGTYQPQKNKCWATTKYGESASLASATKTFRENSTTTPYGCCKCLKQAIQLCKYRTVTATILQFETTAWPFFKISLYTPPR
jgi:hypothetical protein